MVPDVAKIIRLQKKRKYKKVKIQKKTKIKVI